MENTRLPHGKEPAWSPAELLTEEQETTKRNGLASLWYSLTAIPEAPRQASFVRREAARKSRLLSTVTFFLMFIIMLLIPATLFIPNRSVLWLCVIMLVICAISLAFNHGGKTLAAGVFVVTTFELAFFLVIASTRPFDLSNLPLYDMLVLPELLVASLLPGRSIFFVAFINSAFVWADLTFKNLQPRTPALDHYLNSPLFYTALVRPVVVQLLVAVVVYIWVRSTMRAIERADKAEMLARLEHAIAEQKNQLELGIQDILQVHTAVSNGDLDARVPLTQDHMLWPLANALNILLTRFQRAIKAEQGVQRLQIILPPVLHGLQQAEQRHERIPTFQRTNTPLDPLLHWLSGKVITRPPTSTQPAKPAKQQRADQPII